MMMPAASRRLVTATFLLLVTALSCATRPAATPTPAPATSPAPSPAPAAAPAAPSAGSSVGVEWARGAVFYEVFVRSFQDSDGDGVGDLNGLTSRLDMLNDGNPAGGDDLGVDGLWLMPVFESPSYHGYDTVDYDAIDREYGTNDDFARLCREAHRRGMKVIVDLVINHTSAQHPWFQASSSSPSSPKRDWYVWRDQNPGWTQPWGGNPSWHQRNGAWYYGVFWGGMPDLNLLNPAVRAEVQRIAKQWLDRGVDGFRLDAARHAVANGPGELQNDQPETFAFWKEFADYVRKVRPDALLVGENWTDTAVIADYYSVLPMNFNFPLAGAIVDGVKAGSAENARFTLGEMQRLYPAGAIDAPFLTNHDMIRVATQLGNDTDRLRVAAAALLTLPGAPFIYYGEEIGMQNLAGREDEKKRTPLPWDGTPAGGFTTGKPWYPFAPGHEKDNVAAHAAAPGSLRAHYRALIAARKGSRALREGDLKVVELPGASPAVLAFERAVKGERVLVLHNFGSVPVRLGGTGAHATTVFASLGARVDGDAVELPAHASVIVSR